MLLILFNKCSIDNVNKLVRHCCRMLPWRILNCLLNRTQLHCRRLSSSFDLRSLTDWHSALQFLFNSSMLLFSSWRLIYFKTTEFCRSFFVNSFAVKFVDINVYVFFIVILNNVNNNNNSNNNKFQHRQA
jgi:hypothetical protein